MALLQAAGEISYNGFTFPVETETIGIDMKPIPDAAGRTIMAVQYTLKIKSIIAVSSGNDATLETIRNRLLAYGGALVYSTKGLGDLNVNTATRKDLAWGPKTELLQWSPIAGNRAAEIVWTVSFQTLDCANAISRFGIMEFNYKVDYEIGHDRLIKRNHSGRLRIPQTRITQGNKRLSDIADRYYEWVAIPIPLHWRRENEKWGVDESKNVLEFSFTDAQMKMPLPRGVVDMDVEHEQHNDPPVQYWVKVGRLSATYEMAMHAPMTLAQWHFENLWRERLTTLQNDAAGPDPGVPPPNGVVVIPQVYTARENTQRRSANFSVNYRYMRAQPVGNIVAGKMTLLGKVAGPECFWRMVPGASAPNWAIDNEQSGATKPRGYTQATLPRTSDIIADLCPGPSVPSAGGNVLNVTGAIGGGMPSVYLLKQGTPRESWLWYECDIKIEVDDEIVEHSPLPTLPMFDPNKPNPASLADLFDNPNGFDPVPGAYKDDPVKLQRRTVPKVYIYLIGRAMRLGYAIPAPTLMYVGGSLAVRALRAGREYFRTQQLPGTPITVADWILRYVLVKQPKQQLGVPANVIGGVRPGGGQPNPSPPIGAINLDFTTGTATYASGGEIFVYPLPIVIGGGNGGDLPIK